LRAITLRENQKLVFQDFAKDTLPTPLFIPQ